MVQETPAPPASEDIGGEALSSELLLVIGSVCVPIALGSDVTDLMAYKALGNPPIVDGSFQTPQGISVRPSGCTFELPHPMQETLTRLWSEDGMRSPQGAWIVMPAKVGEGLGRLVSADGRVSIRLSRSYDGGQVSAYVAPPEAVFAHYAAMLAANSASPGEAALTAINACSSFMDLEARDFSDELPRRDIALMSRSGGGPAELRGRIGGSMYAGTKGCRMPVEGPGVEVEVARALSAPDSGWTQVTKRSWTGAGGSRVDLDDKGGGLIYNIRPEGLSRFHLREPDWLALDKLERRTGWNAVCSYGTGDMLADCYASMSTMEWDLHVSPNGNDVLLALQSRRCPGSAGERGWLGDRRGYRQDELTNAIRRRQPGLIAEALARCPSGTGEVPTFDGFLELLEGLPPRDPDLAELVGGADFQPDVLGDS